MDMDNDKSKNGKMPIEALNIEGCLYRWSMKQDFAGEWEIFD